MVEKIEDAEIDVSVNAKGVKDFSDQAKKSFNEAQSEADKLRKKIEQVGKALNQQSSQAKQFNDEIGKGMKSLNSMLKSLSMGLGDTRGYGISTITNRAAVSGAVNSTKYSGETQLSQQYMRAMPKLMEDSMYKAIIRADKITSAKAQETMKTAYREQSYMSLGKTSLQNDRMQIVKSLSTNPSMTLDSMRNSTFGSNLNLETEKDRVKLLQEALQYTRGRYQAEKIGADEYKSRRGEILANIQTSKDAIASSTKELSSMERSMTRINEFGGAGLALIQTRLIANYALIGSVISGIRYLITSTIQLDKEFHQLQAIIRITDGSMLNLKDSIYQVAAQTRFTVLEVTQAATVLGQAGLSAREIAETLPAISKLATATGTDLGVSTQILTSALEVYNLQTTEAAHVTNALTTAMNESKAELRGFQYAIQYAGNFAAELGVTYEETAAMVAGAAQSGIRSHSMLGTGLRAMMTEFIKPSKKFVTELESVGLTLDDVDVKAKGLSNVLKTLRTAGFDSTNAFRAMDRRGAAFFAATINQVDFMDRLRTTMASSNAAMEANDIQMKSLSYTWANFASIMSGLASEGLAPVIRSLQVLLELLNDLLQTKMGQWVGQVVVLTGAMMGLAKVVQMLGALGAGVGKLAGVFGLATAVGSGGKLAKVMSGAFLADGVANLLKMKVGAEAAEVAMAKFGKTLAVVGKIGVFTAVSVAIWGIAKGIEYLNSLSTQHRTTLEEHRGRLEEVNDRLGAMDSAYEKVMDKSTQYANDQNELNIITREMANRFRDQGAAIWENVDSVEALVAAMNKYRKANLDLKEVQADRVIKATLPAIQEQFKELSFGKIFSMDKTKLSDVRTIVKALVQSGAVSEDQIDMSGINTDNYTALDVKRTMDSVFEAMRKNSNEFTDDSFNNKISKVMESFVTEDYVNRQQKLYKDDVEGLKKVLEGTFQLSYGSVLDDLKSSLGGIVKFSQEKITQTEEKENIRVQKQAMDAVSGIDLKTSADIKKASEINAESVKTVLKSTEDKLKELPQAASALEKSSVIIEGLRRTIDGNETERKTLEGMLSVFKEGTFAEKLNSLVSKPSDLITENQRKELSKIAENPADVKRLENSPQGRNLTEIFLRIQRALEKNLSEEAEMIDDYYNIARRQRDRRLKNLEKDLDKKTKAELKADEAEALEIIKDNLEADIGKETKGKKGLQRQAIENELIQLAEAEEARIKTLYKDALDEFDKFGTDTKSLIKSLNNVTKDLEEELNRIIASFEAVQKRQASVDSILLERGGISAPAAANREKNREIDLINFQSGDEIVSRRNAQLAEWGVNLNTLKYDRMDPKKGLEAEAAKSTKEYNRLLTLVQGGDKTEATAKKLKDAEAKQKKDVDNLNKSLSEEATIMENIRKAQEEIAYWEAQRLALNPDRSLSVETIWDEFKEAGEDYQNRAQSSKGLAWTGGMFTTGLDTATDEFADFFKGILDGSKTAKQGFLDMTNAILKAMLDIAAQAVATNLFSMLLGGFGIGPSTGSTGVKTQALGGPVVGGVPNRDSVLTKLMPGEFVMKKSAVDALGEDFLYNLNNKGAAAISMGSSTIAPVSSSQGQGSGTVNVWVVSPDQVPPASSNDIIATITQDIVRGGSTKKLIQQVSTGAI